MRWTAFVAILLGVAAFGLMSPGTGRAIAQDKTPEAPAGGKIKGTVTGKPSRFLKLGILVYVENVKGEFPPPKEHAVMDQKGMKFVPHILPILVGTTVDFLNSDPVAHNVFSPDGEKYNLGTWAQGQTKAYTFKQLGVYTQLCQVHAEMEGYVVVLQNPYFALANEDGQFELENVPSGTHTVVAWNERMEPGKAEVTVKAGEVAKIDFTLKRK